MLKFNFRFLSNPSISTCTTSKRGRTGAAVQPGHTTFFSRRGLQGLQKIIVRNGKKGTLFSAK
jgi:hypothetical protein